MPAFALATIPFWSAAAAAGGAVASGALASHGVSSAADKQMQAQNYAADQQKKAADEQLAYQRQQAENTYRQQEADRKANYDQWAARMASINSARKALGYTTVDVKPYVPMVDPQYTNGTTPLPSTVPASTTPNTPAATGASAVVAGQPVAPAGTYGAASPVMSIGAALGPSPYPISMPATNQNYPVPGMPASKAQAAQRALSVGAGLGY